MRWDERFHTHPTVHFPISCANRVEGIFPGLREKLTWCFAFTNNFNISIFWIYTRHGNNRPMETLTINSPLLSQLGELPPCHRQDVRPWSEILTGPQQTSILSWWSSSPLSWPMDSWANLRVNFMTDTNLYRLKGGLCCLPGSPRESKA